MTPIQTEALVIRDVTAADREDWLRLWAGYTAFYETEVAPRVSAHTWARLLDPAVPMLGRVAQSGTHVVGFSIAVLHEGTWVAAPIGYLEDLFVDPAHRGLGIGKRLIEDLVALGRARGWSRLYWHTRQDNPARKLYDTFVQADDFVRYQLAL